MIFQLYITIKIRSSKSEGIYDDSAAKVMRLKMSEKLNDVIDAKNHLVAIVNGLAYLSRFLDVDSTVYIRVLSDYEFYFSALQHIFKALNEQEQQTTEIK